MAVRDILLYSKHPAELRQKSKGVAFVNQKVLRLIRDLKDTLEASSDGIGLAAPQINIHKRVVIACPGSVEDGRWQAGPPVALINLPLSTLRSLALHAFLPSLSLEIAPPGDLGN
jgi:peptide deformylase